MSGINLSKDPDNWLEKDAAHVPTIVCKASEPIRAREYVVIENGMASKAPKKDCNGIVNPFGKKVQYAVNELVLVLLKPNQIAAEVKHTWEFKKRKLKPKLGSNQFTSRYSDPCCPRKTCKDCGDWSIDSECDECGGCKGCGEGCEDCPNPRGCGVKK